MKRIYIVFLILLSFTVRAGIVIVSDLDDTIKITNSGKEIDGAINAVFTKDVFTGIPEFIEAARLYSGEFHILSASPTFLRPFVQSTLKKHDISYDSLNLRNLLRREEMFVYKLNFLKKLLSQSTDDFILLGDDIGKDPEVFDEIRRLFPNRILASYVHVIKDREVPRSSERYYTSFDLFLREYMAGRMSKSWVDAVAKLSLAEVNKKLIFPSFAACPKTPTVWLWQLRTAFARESLTLTKAFNAYCVSRWSDTIPLPAPTPLP